jgi:hypothetical protein
VTPPFSSHIWYSQRISHLPTAPGFCCSFFKKTSQDRRPLRHTGAGVGVLEHASLC